MGSWDINYHKGELEKAYGGKWAPVADSLPGALAQVRSTKTLIAALKMMCSILTMTCGAAVASMAAGVFVGVFSIYQTVGPTVAFILGGLGILIVAMAARIWLAIAFLPRFECQLGAAEGTYQKLLDEAVAA